jgi:hypothetical protein
MASLPGNFEVPAIDRWLDTQPKPFVVAEVPAFNPDDAGAFEQLETRYMIHSSAHWQKTVHGYSGWRTQRAVELFMDLASFPDERSIASLSDLGVTYVVVHTDTYSPEEWRRVEAQLVRFSPRLRLLHAEGPGRVYTLVNERR